MIPTRRFHAALALLILLTLFSGGDGPSVRGLSAQTAGEAVPASSSFERPGANVVDIVARGLEFVAPDRIPSGWTTFRLTNGTGLAHFAVLERLPEGRTLEDSEREVVPVFQDGMDLLAAGRTDAAMEAFGELPEWFGQIVFLGGPGLVAPGRTAQTTVNLDPGTYVVECYVKTDGIFHSYSGMVAQIVVTDEPAGGSPPRPDVEISVSSERGIEVEGEIRAGLRTVAVHFADQTAHEHFLGHDVHLVRLGPDTDLDEVAAWMDWSRPGSLDTPAPAEFLGGIHEMPAGETGYFTAELTPGRYAWIAEVPDPSAKGMLKTFTVPSGGEGAR